MKAVFEFRDYRLFIRKSLESRGRNGFGQTSWLADFVGVHNSYVSQVLSSKKSFSDEQALMVSRYLNLNSLEQEYFLLLVRFENAGTKEFKDHLAAQLKAIKEKASELVHRVQHETKLTEEQRAVFYSDWIYSAIRLSTLIPKQNNVNVLSSKFGLSEKKANEVVNFLVGAGLLKQEKGELSIGPLSTHLEASSPWIKAHHANWRQQALNKITEPSSVALHYSAPMTLSKQDAEKIREVLIAAINQVDSILEPSPSEDLMCLNIDWFKI